MKKILQRLTLPILAVLFLSMTSYGQDFSYTPKNPAFGGSYFNYNWMLSSAQAQNSHTDPNAVSRDNSRDPLEDFQNSLNRQLLSQISRRVLGDQFGEDGLEEGTFTVGDFTIDISESLNGILITIIDLTTGNQSVIEVPNL